MDHLSRRFSDLERDRCEDLHQLVEYKEENLDLWSCLDRVERRLAESEVQVELLKEEARARHQVNPVAPCVKIDLTQGGDGDWVYLISITDPLIDDDEMTDEQVTALYDDVIELAGGEDLYVPGAYDLVPVREEPLRVWEGVESVGRRGRDVWSWSTSALSGNDDVLSSEELKEIRIDVEGPILTTTADDETDAVVRGGWRVLRHM